MKILHFIDSLRIGGSENQTVEVAKRQSASGHAVTIGCIRLEGPFAADLAAHKIRCIEFRALGGLFSFSGLRQMLRLFWFIRQQRFDVVHAHDVYSNLMAVPPAWLARTGCILSSRRDLGRWSFHTPRNRRILRYCQMLSDHVIANSEGVKRYLIDQDGFNKSKIVVVRNAVDLSRFDDANLEPAKIESTAASDFLVAVVANMHGPTKGHEYLIQAAEKICPSNPQIRFVLVGDGELRPKLESEIRARNLEGHFIFLGQRRDIANILKSVQCGLLPSLSEGLPNSVLEYMAAGLPVIATNVGGIPELIEDGSNGLLIAPADAQQLAHAIEYMYRNQSIARQMGNRAKELAGSRFGFERLLSELDSLYSA